MRSSAASSCRATPGRPTTGTTLACEVIGLIILPRRAAWEKQRQADGRAPPKEAWGYREALRLALESFALATPEALVPPRPAGVKLGAAT